MSGSRGIKSFVSETEAEEVRKKRQEEWEKVRKPDDPIGELKRQPVYVVLESAVPCRYPCNDYYKRQYFKVCEGFCESNL